jgi:hypothetical protein
MVPVTTKPFLNSVNFSLLQRVFLHFFSLLEEKTNQHITFCKRVYGMRCCVNHSDTSFCVIIRLTLQTSLHSFLASLNTNKGGFYNGKSSGIRKQTAGTRH